MRHRPPTRARCLTSTRLVACASAAFLTSACAERHATLSDSPALPIAPIAVDASPRVMAERTSRMMRWIPQTISLAPVPIPPGNSARCAG